MENFDHKTYRDSLASTLLKEEDHRKRRKLLKLAQFTNEYGAAKQLHAKDMGRELTPERQDMYEALAEKVGDTPLVEYKGEVPDGNKIFLKLECDNQLGHSHYDRVYLKLFYEKEKLGIIHPGDNVFETSTGSAGISFAAIGRELGYKCHVAMPAGGEKAREQATAEQGAQVHLTPAEQYIRGFRDFIKKFLKEHPDYVFINHSMGNILGKGSDINENAVVAMQDVATESEDQLHEQQEGHFDYVISAMGNGTNTLGISQRMNEISPTTKIVGFEMMSSAVAFQQKYPGKYQETFGKEVEPKKFSRHSMPGTSFPGIDFPAFNKAIGLLDDIKLVTDEKTTAEYKQMAGIEDEPEALIHWDNSEIEQPLEEFGRSTKAGVAVALRIIHENEVVGKKFLVIAYDKTERYDVKK